MRKIILSLLALCMFLPTSLIAETKIIKNDNPKFEFSCPNDWSCDLQDMKKQMGKKPKRPPRDYSRRNTPLTVEGYGGLVSEMAHDAAEDAVQDAIQGQLIKHYQKQLPNFITIYLTQNKNNEPATITMYISDANSKTKTSKFNCRAMKKSQGKNNGCEVVECKKIKWANQKVQVLTTRCKNDDKTFTYSSTSNFTRGKYLYSLMGEQISKRKEDSCPEILKSARNTFLNSFIFPN